MTIAENDLWKVELELEGGSLSPETAKALIQEVRGLRDELSKLAEAKKQETEEAWESSYYCCEDCAGY